MTKTPINVYDYATEIVSAIPKGVLLTTKSGGRVNSMAIGWGTLGTIWRNPVFIAFIREGRFTRSLLDESRDFTVNVPRGADAKSILRFCGSRSGRDVDKAAELGLTLVPAERVQSPAVAELPLTLECRALYRQPLELAGIPKDIRIAMYPQEVDGSHPMANRDTHVAYYGEIVSAYILG